ncbi:PP2C family protein-serine/threonine phosphatase [Streptomyces sp. NPDC088923]|uniref:PP2C family protein-serine/threonine phosphatase n=1 Tax=Streptomyces sp. NPDC088923 TaxID=3365913 RepID=UPI0037FC3FEE
MSSRPAMRPVTSRMWGGEPLRLRGHRVAWFVPAALFVLIVALDWNTEGDFRMITWIIVVPGIAAALCGVWATAGFALLSCVAYLLMNLAWSEQYRTGWPNFILVVGGGAVAVASCALRLRAGRYVGHLQDVAETTRSTVLRPLPPHWAGMEQAAIYLPADTTARVGGDFYDIQPSRYGTRVILGDVQGKGLQAVTAASAILGSFREWGYHAPDLAVVAERLETRMRRHQAYSAVMGIAAEEDRFATAALLGFPPMSGHDADPLDEAAQADPAKFPRPTPYEMEMVDFGHETPLAVSPRGVREIETVPVLPLGLSGLVTTVFAVQRFRVAADETLLLVTDGVTEARDRTGEFFPLVERLGTRVAADARCAEPARLVALVRDEVLRYTGGRLTDDTTILAVRRAGGPDWPREPPERARARSGATGGAPPPAPTSPAGDIPAKDIT